MSEKPTSMADLVVFAIVVVFVVGLLQSCPGGRKIVKAAKRTFSRGCGAL